MNRNMSLCVAGGHAVADAGLGVSGIKKPSRIRGGLSSTGAGVGGFCGVVVVFQMALLIPMATGEQVCVYSWGRVMVLLRRSLLPCWFWARTHTL